MAAKLGPAFDYDGHGRRRGRKRRARVLSESDDFTYGVIEERPTVPWMIGLTVLVCLGIAVMFMALWLLAMTGLEVVQWLMSEDVGP